MDELQIAIRRNPDNQTAIVRTELAYYRNTHPDDVRSNPDLFKLQGPAINHDVRLENFCLILADCENETPGGSIVDLPTTRDLMKALEIDQIPPPEDEPNETENLIQTNKLCAVLWIHKNVKNWYLGYITHKQSEVSFSVEHLERVSKNNVYWQYCDPPEELDVDISQIIPVHPKGEWDMTNIRQTRLLLSNHAEIQKSFTEMNF